jgi:hypothetical protein
VTVSFILIFYTVHIYEVYGSVRSMKKLGPTKQRALLVIVGLVLGIFTFGLFRFAMVKDDHVHYHANFALYINGQRDEFKSFTFYEEIAACDAHQADNPKTRSHMHDNNNHLVHVHASGITWGDFFNNLGYTLGDTLIKTDNGAYLTGDDGNQLSFLLNGQKATAIANKVIYSEDVLLVNYGKDDGKTLQSRYDGIPRDAGHANHTADPSACQGPEKFTFTTRLKKALGFETTSH